MIIPVGAPGDQQLYLLRKHGAKIDQQAVLPWIFYKVRSLNTFTPTETTGR
jgi:hypothetical protein